MSTKRRGWIVPYLEFDYLTLLFFHPFSHSRLCLCVFFAPNYIIQENFYFCACVCVCVCLFIRFFFLLSIDVVAFALVRGAISVYSYISYRSFFRLLLSFHGNCRWFSAKRLKLWANVCRLNWLRGVRISLYLYLSLCVCVCVVVGRHCNRYYYVRYQTISIIGYQNCCRTWWWHCCYCLFSLCVWLLALLSPPPKPIFRCAICYAQFHTKTPNMYTYYKYSTFLRQIRAYLYFRFNLTFQFCHIVFSLSLSLLLSPYAAVGMRGKESSARLPYLIFFDWCHNGNSIRTSGF